MFVRVTLMIGSFFVATSLLGAEPGEETAELSKAYGIQIPEQAPGRCTGEGNGPFPRSMNRAQRLIFRVLHSPGGSDH